MSASSATTILAELRTLAEDLHGALGAADRKGAREIVNKIIAADLRLQEGVRATFAERDRRERLDRLVGEANERQSDLQRLAKRMHAAEVELGEYIKRSRKALQAADATLTSERHLPAAAIVECAQRVSYTTSAPCGQVAFEGAAKQDWYHGWGAPAPQQHLLANAQFAAGRPAAIAAQATAATADGGGGDGEQVASAGPTFTSGAPQPAAAAAAADASRPGGESYVSLALNSDDEDDEDDEFD